MTECEKLDIQSVKNPVTHLRDKLTPAISEEEKQAYASTPLLFGVAARKSLVSIMISPMSMSNVILLP